MQLPRHRFYSTRLFFIVLLLALVSFSAHAEFKTSVHRFALLPQGAGNPEALTVDEQGNVYVTTFAGELFVFGSNGKLLRSLTITPGNPLLDLAFHPITGALLVIDFGRQQVLDVDPMSGVATLFAAIPGGTAAGPNVLTFDTAGNVYISDSFQGTIWRTGPEGGTPDAWVNDLLLTTSGFPGFGANGMAFNQNHSTLFVANTGDDSIIQIPVEESGNAGTPELFVNGINGPDGLLMDEQGNLWIAANQANEIIVLDPTGRALTTLGGFGGIDNKGAVVGLLFPADLARSGQFLYVTNFAVDLRQFGLTQTPYSQWAAQVQRHSIVRLPFTLPPLHGSR